jgi:hypothetical protein
MFSIQLTRLVTTTAALQVFELIVPNNVGLGSITPTICQWDFDEDSLDSKCYKA